MPAELFSVEQVERARRYHRPLYLALLLDVTLGLGVLSVLAFTREGAWLYSAVDELPWWGRALAFPGLVLSVSTLVRLPLSFWRGYLHEHRWKLSTQGVRGWLLDRLKGFAVGVVLTPGAVLGLVALARWSPSAWPLVAAPAAAVIVLLVAGAPRQIRLVVAHELGHRRARHVAKATVLGMAGAAATVLALWALVSHPGDPRSAPRLLLVAGALELAALPFASWLSRRWEREADRFSLEL